MEATATGEVPESSVTPAPSDPDARGTEQPTGTATLPQECEQYLEGEAPTDPIAVAASDAALPEGVVLMGAQVLTSSGEEGMFDAVARTCSVPMGEDELRTVGTAIALAIYNDPAGESLDTLRVTSWVPDGAGSIEEDVKIRSDDFQAYLWGHENADSNWEVQGIGY